MHHIQRPDSLPLREAHAHLPSHGRSLAMLDLSQCTTRREALERVRERAMTAGTDQPWILGIGLRIHGFVDDPTWPTRQELDAIDAARPICLMSFDHHSVVASTAALAASGIELAAADPPGGVICRDASGLATGVLLESAAMQNDQLRLAAIALQQQAQERQRAAAGQAALAQKLDEASRYYRGQ